MTTHSVSRTGTGRALVWGGLLAVVWIAVAFLRPGTTFHLAPLLISGAPPVFVSLEDGSPSDLRSIAVVGAIAAAIALVTALLLSSVGAMTGPAFEGFPTPMIEAVVFTAIGAGAGVGFGWLRSR